MKVWEAQIASSKRLALEAIYWIDRGCPREAYRLMNEAANYAAQADIEHHEREVERQIARQEDSS